MTKLATASRSSSRAKSSASQTEHCASGALRRTVRAEYNVLITGPLAIRLGARSMCEAVTMAVVRDLRVLVRFRDFRRLLAVRLLSQLSDGVYQVALAAYVVFTPQKQASAEAIAAAMAVL